MHIHLVRKSSTGDNCTDTQSSCNCLEKRSHQSEDRKGYKEQEKLGSGGTRLNNGDWFQRRDASLWCERNGTGEKISSSRFKQFLEII